MDEEADLALLDQHLIKTNQLSQRMTGILSQLDARLTRIDKTVAPLGIQPHYRHAQNLDKLLAHLEPAAGRPALVSAHSGSPADETAIITRGPDMMALSEYITAINSVRDDLERMDSAGSRAREAGIRDLSALVDQGLSSLVQVVLLSLRSDSLGPVSTVSLVENGPFQPHQALPSLPLLAPVTSYLASLQHSSSSAVQGLARLRWKEVSEGYATSRGHWGHECIARSAEFIDDMDTGNGLGGSAEGEMRSAKIHAIVEMGRALVVIAETEISLHKAMWPSETASVLLPMVLEDAAGLVNATIGNVINSIKKAVSAHTILALDLYEALAGLQTRWEVCLESWHTKPNNASNGSTRPLQSLFVSHLNALRSILLRSFPELLVDIKTAAATGANSNITSITHSTIRYLENIPLHETVIGNLLHSLGERNWLMGASEPPSPAKPSTEGGLLRLFVADVIGTLINHLTQRAQGMKRLIAATFLLNNLSYMRETTSSFPSDIIGPGAEDMLNKAFREAKSSYLTEWRSTAALLSTNQSSMTPRFGVGGNSERQQMKDSIAAFFERFDEMERLSRQHQISRQEAELRNRLGKEAISIVVPSFAACCQRAQSKSLEKCLRFSAAELERRMEALFS